MGCKHKSLKQKYLDSEGTPYYGCEDCGTILEVQLWRPLTEEFLTAIFHCMGPETVVEALKRIADE
jgi:hypothetical protein